VNSFVSCIGKTSYCCCFPGNEFPWVPSSEIPSCRCQRDPDKWMGRSMDWEQWRGTLFGLGRSRGREMVEIGRVVGEYQWVVGYLSCEGTMRNTLQKRNKHGTSRCIICQGMHMFVPCICIECSHRNIY